MWLKQLLYLPALSRHDGQAGYRANFHYFLCSFIQVRRLATLKFYDHAVKGVYRCM